MSLNIETIVNQMLNSVQCQDFDPALPHKQVRANFWSRIMLMQTTSYWKMDNNSHYQDSILINIYPQEEFSKLFLKISFFKDSVEVAKNQNSQVHFSVHPKEIDKKKFDRKALFKDAEPFVNIVRKFLLEALHECIDAYESAAYSL